MGLRVRVCYAYAALLLLGASLLETQGQVLNITMHPMDRLNVPIGDNVTFSVTATGADAYQWLKDGADVMDTADTYSGTMTDTLTVLSVMLSDQGFYSCMVSNGSESVNSTAARLDVVADCGPLTNPPNGTVNTSAGTTEGMTANYTCDTGYTLSGMETRTCGADGVWSPAEPTCQIVDCMSLPHPANGMVTSTATTFGSTATYTCDIGYTLNGMETRTCGPDGVWNSTEPVCQIVDCGNAPGVTNGGVTVTTTTFMSNATYTCNNGYMLNGESTIMCQSNGNWTMQPTCDLVNCGSPPNVTNGGVTVTTTTFGSNATYSCNTGYMLNGESTIMCQSGGTWSVQPTCDPVDCGSPPNVTNAMVTVGTTTFGSIATYSCAMGYIIDGSDGNVTCGGNMMWSTEPSCALATPMVTQTPPGPHLPGSSVQFGLSVSSPALSYQWLVGGVEVADSQGRYNGTTTTMLMVSNLNDTDNGRTVSCLVSDSSGDEVNSTTVTIIILPRPVITSFPMDAVVGANLNTNLTCSATPPGVTLRIDTTAPGGRTLPQQTSTSVSLAVNGATVQDRGVYTCVATNARDSVMSDATLSVVVVQDIPGQTAPTGNDVTFACMIDGAPNTSVVQYTWNETFMGNPVLSFLAGVVSGADTNMLTISNLGRMDGDNDFTCFVTVDGTMVGRATAQLTVTVPFFVQELPNVNLTLNAPESLNLSCVGENPPGAVSPLLFRWSIGGDLVSESDSRITNTPIPPNRLRSQLLIINTTTRNTGEYYCILSNRMPFSEQQSVQSSIDVRVFFTPELSFVDAPYVFRAGATATITCRVVASPQASFAEIVEILANGTESRPTRADNLVSPITVERTINSISLMRHSRTFVCRANNTNGLATLPTTITVIDVPDQIDHALITSQPISLASMEFQLTPPSDNNADITSYYYTLCQTDGSMCISTPRTDTLAVNELMMVNQRLQFTIGELEPQRMYSLRVSAVNSVGTGPIPNITDGFIFSSSTPADGTPANLMVDTRFITQTGLVVTWTLPTLGAQPDVTASVFTVRWMRQGGGGIDNTTTVQFNRGSTTQGLSITGLNPNNIYSVRVTAMYTTPVLTSEPNVTTGTTLMEGPNPPPLTDSPPSPQTNDVNGVLMISWTAPPNVRFIDDYRVRYTITSLIPSSRKRRQTGGEITMFTGGPTSFTVPDVQPFARYMFNVDAGISPPGSTSPVFVPVTPSVNITSSHQAPNAPTNPIAVPSANGDPFRALDFSWDHPSMPRGILVSCAIDFTEPTGKGQSTVPPVGGVVPQTHIQENLLPGTTYTFTIHCFSASEVGQTGERGVSSAPMSARTSLGVFKPLLVLGAINQERRQVTATLTFSSLFGSHQLYHLVVSSIPLMAEDLPRLSPPPQAEPGNNGYYVTYGDLSRDDNTPFTVTIGAGVPVTATGVTYTNPAPGPGTYYVFVRLFADTSNRQLFNDSDIVIITIDQPFNAVAVIVPIALVALILLLILIGLLIFAVLRIQSPARRRHYVPGDKGMTDGKRKRSNNIELRRTRLFSPMLNVGSPDVFTSAGQPTTLICEASGTPAPEVTWTKDGEPLDKERFIQLADSSLFINETDLQDEGEYVVTAINSAGQADQLVKVTVLRPVPPEPDEDHAPVKVGDFTEKLALLRANDDEALEDEYADIELDWTFTSYAAKLNINKNKNRYINIIPYDHARVVLSLQDNTPGSDYINGSYVDGHGRDNAYIATQGPIPSTFPDFWRMIWEMDSPTIVMVTNLKEEDKVKCHQYWPSYGSTTYGNIQVTLKEVENLAEYSIRTFTVTPLAGQSRAQMPVREVRQFHFLVWPDHGVPQYATALLTFRKRVIRYHSEKRGPMVVHCSAGVGRTGTFITIDVCLKRIEAEGDVDIFNYVRHMRFRRNYMVQTASQYVFIHDAILESIMCGDNSIPAPELRTKIQALSEVNPETGKSSFASQFDTLNTTSPADDEFDCSVAQLPDNAVKNRFKEHLPSNEFRVTLSSEDDKSDYICASFVDGYRHRNNFIVTQAPLQDTVGDFWRMVWEHKSAAIIMLTQTEEGGQEMSVKYWPSVVGEAGVFGAFQVELSEDEKDKGEYITRRFKLSLVDNPQESRMLTQFHYTRWPKTTPPEDPHPILDLIDELQRVQRKSGNGPITVHCDNGFGRTGTFCTLYTVLERVKAEQVVDVFQAVKTLRIQRVGLMETLDEYIFVHKAVQKFLDSFSDYQNFK